MVLCTGVHFGNLFSALNSKMDDAPVICDSESGENIEENACDYSLLLADALEEDNEIWSQIDVENVPDETKNETSANDKTSQIDPTNNSVTSTFFNDNKAGMVGFSWEKMNTMIENNFKKSSFYDIKVKKQDELDKKIQELKRAESRITEKQLETATKQVKIEYWCFY